MKNINVLRSNLDSEQQKRVFHEMRGPPNSSLTFIVMLIPSTLLLHPPQ